MGYWKTLDIEVQESTGVEYGTPDYYAVYDALESLSRNDVHHVIKLAGKEPMTALAWATEARIIPLVITFAQNYGATMEANRREEEAK